MKTINANNDAMVSIITPGYNEDRNIHRLLESILSQDYDNIEFIFVDDGSTDNTKQVVESYREKFAKRGFLLKYYYQKNAGQAAAINLGLKHYTGEYITWIDGDDFLDNASIFKRVSALQGKGEGHFVITQARFVDDKDATKVLSIEKRNKPIAEDNFFIDLIYERNVLWASGGGFMVSSKDFKKAIPANQIYPSREGQNFQLMAPLAYHCECIYIEEPLYNVVCRRDSHSRLERSLEGKISGFLGHKIHKSETVKALHTPNETELLQLIEFIYYRKIAMLAFKMNDEQLFYNSLSKVSEYIKDVYNWLEDDLSKELLTAVAEYHITYDISSLSKIVKNSTEFVKTQMANLKNDILSMTICEDEMVVIYGAGFYGKFMLRYLSNKFKKGKFVFCDRNYSELKEVESKKVISPQDLLNKYKTYKVVVPKNQFTKEIINTLIDNGFPKENIYTIEQMIFDEDEYFDKDIIKLGKDEVFVDAGAYDGKVSIIFADKCKDYKKIYMFEPDNSNISKFIPEAENLSNSKLLPLGVWDKRATLMFKNSGSTGCRIGCGDNSVKLAVDTVDNICNDTPVTFIKYDVEGAELNALKGAKATIIKNKPKLAICIYHKPEDIYEIPRYIKSLVPEYKLYIRHYSNTAYSTVLYAIVD